MEVTLYVTDMLENRLSIVNGYNLTLPLSLLVHRKITKKICLKKRPYLVILKLN